MKRITLLFVFILGTTAILQAQGNWPFRGTVIKMRMTDCVMQHGFMATMSGVVPAGTSCPEYTVMTDKVVYVVVGRRAEEFIPLSEEMDFVVRKNELMIFSGNEKTKSHFLIQQMKVREDWEREERMMERNANSALHNPMQSSVVSANAR
jgi:hypothetical protein